MEKQLSQEEVWDNISKPWQEFREKPKPWVIDFLKNQEGKILDLACGTGRHFIKLEKAKIYGVDFSKEMIKRAKAYVKRENLGIVLKKARADKIPYKADFFNAAIFIAALHCIETREKRKKALEELYRVLRKDGEALITVLSKGHGRVKNKGKETKVPWSVEGKKYYRYYYVYDKKELENLLKEVGFKFVKIWIWDNKNIFAIVRK